MIRISDEGVVSASNCLLPELKVQYAAVSNNMICGGETPDTINQCKDLNPDSLKWQERSPMNVKRSGHAMTTANNQTRYACGGFDESYEYLKSCEKFNGEWSFIKDVPIALGGHCMIGSADFVYLIGGDYGSVSKQLKSISIYEKSLIYFNI